MSIYSSNGTINKYELERRLDRIRGGGGGGSKLDKGFGGGGNPKFTSTSSYLEGFAMSTSKSTSLPADTMQFNCPSCSSVLEISVKVKD